MLKLHMQDSWDRLSAPFREDPSKSGGSWQVRWDSVPFWGGLSPSLVKAKELRSLLLCIVSSPPCSSIPTALCPPCLLLEGFTALPRGLALPVSLEEDMAQALRSMSSQKVFFANQFSQVKSIKAFLSLASKPVFPSRRGRAVSLTVNSSVGAVAMLCFRPWWSSPLSTSSSWFFFGHPAGEVGKERACLQETLKKSKISFFLARTFWQRGSNGDWKSPASVAGGEELLL